MSLSIPLRRARLSAFAFGATIGTAPPETTYTNNYDRAKLKVRHGGCRVRDVINGTEGPDRLVGTKKPEAIYGLGKNDKLKGKGGEDCLFGNEGNDRIAGGPGNDQIDGGDGSDVLIGGPGKDIIKGGAGNDLIKARDGKRDRINCGKGKRDKAIVDKKDIVRNCERVRRR